MDRYIEKKALSGGAEEELLQNWLKKKRMWCHRNHRKECSRVEGVNCTESWENK